MSRTQNALRNIGWGFVQKVIAMLLPFISRTVLIKVLGADYLGLGSLFTAILGLISLAELGVSNAIISSMYKPIADGDTDVICALMAFFRKAYYCIGAVITIVGIAILPLISFFIKGDIPPNINIYILYIVYLFNTSISYFLFAYKNCLFVAHQRNDVNSKIYTLCMILQNLLQILILIFLKNYYCYVIVIPVITISINIITAKIADREFPEYCCRGNLQTDLYSDLKKKVAGLMVSKISSTIRSSIDSLFISMFLGLTAVAMYTNYFYIVTSIVGVIQILESSLVAGVGDSIAVESVEKNYNDMHKFTFVLQWIVGWCAIAILCLEQVFMEIWVGKELMFKDSMVVLCSLYLFVNCICLIRSIYTQALGMWWTLKCLSIIDIFVNVFFNYFLGKTYGAYGILAATIIDIVFISIPWTTYYLFRDYFGMDKFAKYMLGYLKYFVVFVIAGGITWFVCSSIMVESIIFKFIVNIIICVVVPNIIYLVAFSRERYFIEGIHRNHLF